MSSDDQPKTVREAINLGFQNDIAKGKFFQDQSQEMKLEKIEVKYQKEMFQRQFSSDQLKPQVGEDVRIARYFDFAIKDIKSFFKGIFGDDYEPKNDFSLSQKQKILKYLYFKNKSDMDNPLRYKSAYGGIEQQDMKIYMLQNKIQGIEKLKFDNRVLFINQIAQCQNRIRYNGFLWGIFFSSILWGTLMRKQSIIRKVCLTVTLTHIGGIFLIQLIKFNKGFRSPLGLYNYFMILIPSFIPQKYQFINQLILQPFKGQIASYRSIDRIFDSFYPIFQKDYDQFFVDEEKRKQEHVVAGGIKTDEIQILIEESMKQIRKGKKIAKESEEYD